MSYMYIQKHNTVICSADAVVKYCPGLRDSDFRFPWNYSAFRCILLNIQTLLPNRQLPNQVDAQ